MLTCVVKCFEWSKQEKCIIKAVLVPAERWHGGHPRLPFTASDCRPHDTEMDAQSADERQRRGARFREKVRPTEPNRARINSCFLHRWLKYSLTSLSVCIGIMLWLFVWRRLCIFTVISKVNNLLIFKSPKLECEEFISLGIYCDFIQWTVAGRSCWWVRMGFRDPLYISPKEATSCSSSPVWRLACSLMDSWTPHSGTREERSARTLLYLIFNKWSNHATYICNYDLFSPILFTVSIDDYVSFHVAGKGFPQTQKKESSGLMWLCIR